MKKYPSVNPIHHLCASLSGTCFLLGWGTHAFKTSLGTRLGMPEGKYFYSLYHGYYCYFLSVLFLLREWSTKLSLVEVPASLF